jgi:two-component system osmolarity sensor histidine kinase EnvZ
MRARIARHIEQRTALLASVSHDLRTPLTRLKLELALSPPGSRVEAMKADLADMEHMIDEYLAFARVAHGATAGGEPVESVSLRDVIDEVSAGAERAGARVAVAAEPGLAAQVRPNAFKRALSNLVHERRGAWGARAGHRAPARAGRGGDSGGRRRAGDSAGPLRGRVQAVQPAGPGANQNEKGVGLGLALARDVARNHGGDVTLERSPLGGLRAVVRLPG